MNFQCGSNSAVHLCRKGELAESHAQVAEGGTRPLSYALDRSMRSEGSKNCRGTPSSDYRRTCVRMQSYLLQHRAHASSDLGALGADGHQRDDRNCQDADV